MPTANQVTGTTQARVETLHMNKREDQKLNKKHQQRVLAGFGPLMSTDPNVLMARSFAGQPLAVGLDRLGESVRKGTLQAPTAENRKTLVGHVKNGAVSANQGSESRTSAKYCQTDMGKLDPKCE